MSAIPKSKLVIIEGPNGAGKSSLVEGIKKHSPQMAFFREPGGTPLGDMLRTILKTWGNKFDVTTQTSMFLVGRQELYATRIGPILERHSCVVDRGPVSTLVYQVLMQGGGKLRSKVLQHFIRCLKNLPEHEFILVRIAAPEVSVRQSQEPDVFEEMNRRKDELKYYDLAFDITHEALSRAGVAHRLVEIPFLSSGEPEECVARRVEILARHLGLKDE